MNVKQYVKGSWLYMHVCILNCIHHSFNVIDTALVIHSFTGNMS
uniref:Uncharacterized protein n=1 Tax=Anguilla anguilla TaxID=7936 RepID=A0A0E9TD92_ANGAN